MFKKLIAAGATLAVALGIVALVAAPAQAHDGHVKVTQQCVNGNYVLTWTSNVQDTPGNDTSVSKMTFAGAQAGPGNVSGPGAWDGSAYVLNTPTPGSYSYTFGSTHRLGNYTDTFTQTLPGTTKATVTGYGSYFWPMWNGGTAGSDQASAVLDGSCTVNTTSGAVDIYAQSCAPGQLGVISSAYVSIADVSKVQYSITYGPVGGSSTTIADAGTRTDIPVGNTAVNVDVTAKGRPGYTLIGTKEWTKQITPIAVDCKQHLQVSGTLTPTAAVCVAANTPGTGSVSFSNLPTGAVWTYSTNGTDYQPVPSGNVVSNLKPGQEVWGQIVAQQGYVIDSGGAPITTKVPTLNASDCVSPADLTIGQKQAVCDSNNPGVIPTGSFTVPTSDTVTYTYQGGVVNGSTQQVTVGDQLVQVTVTATPKPGYQFPNNAASISIVLKFNAIDHTGCVFDAVVANPTVMDAVCTGNTPPLGYTQGYYNLPKVTGVSYQVSLNGKAGPYDSNPVVGSNVSVAAGTQLWITASVDPTKYTLIGYPAGGWDYTKTFVKTQADCETAVKIAVAQTNQSCTPDAQGYAVFTDGSITVTAVPHATYSISGVGTVDTTGKTGPVTTTVAPGTYYVNVKFDTGYKADPTSNYPTGGWQVVVKSADVCGQLHTHALVDPAFTPHAAGCFAQGSFTLSSDQDSIDPNAVIWTVNGSTVKAGTYPISAGQTVRVSAAPNTADDYGFADPTTAAWTYTGPASAGTCDLKTLALTGVGDASAFLGLGYLAVIAGLSLLAVAMIRRRRSTEE